MVKIGLTGGIGSGKTTISKIFKEKNIPVIYTDLLHRSVLEKYDNLKREISDMLGGDFFSVSGELDRKKLGNYVFRNKEVLLKLNNLMLPYIKKEIKLLLLDYEKEGVSYVILECAYLIEAQFVEEFNLDELVVVDTDIETQLERLCSRDNLDVENAFNRIKSQISNVERVSYGTYIIENKKGTSLLSLNEQVKCFLEYLREKEREGVFFEGFKD